MIYINAYWDREHPPHAEDGRFWIQVNDGGTRVFSAVYDISTGTLDGPWFNGYA